MIRFARHSRRRVQGRTGASRTMAHRSRRLITWIACVVNLRAWHRAVTASGVDSRTGMGRTDKMAVWDRLVSRRAMDSQGSKARNAVRADSKAALRLEACRQGGQVGSSSIGAIRLGLAVGIAMAL